MTINKNSLYLPVLLLMLVIAALYVNWLSSKANILKNEPVSRTDGFVEEDRSAVSPISVENLKIIAKDLGINSGKFDKCLDEGIFFDKVASESAYGEYFLGVYGTPSFFINGIFVEGAKSQADFEAIIDAELKNGSGDKVITDSVAVIKRVDKVPYGDGYIRGKKDAQIKIMEYSDFECPNSARVYPTIKTIISKYGDRVSLEYRSYPLPFDPNAKKAAEAVYCAGEQGKFWEMHDKMFTVMMDNFGIKF